MKNIKTLIASSITLTLLCTNTLTAFANSDDRFTEANMSTTSWSDWSNKWENIKNDWTKICLTPGKNQTELNFAWYSNNTSPAQVKIAKKSEMNGENFPANSKIFTGTTSSAVEGFNSNKVTVTNLDADTEYMYSYKDNDTWKDAVAFKTGNAKNFRILYVGDPQIGSSKSNTSSIDSKVLGQDRASRNDSYNWNNTLNTALSNNSNVNFMISAGDQINMSDSSDKLSTKNEIEYSGFLCADSLKSLPVATTIGNHDSKNSNYSFHFNNPNASEYGLTNAGGDYYYSYNDALFITLNTNNINIAEHDALIKKAIIDNPNAKWRIITIHHDIYGTGAPHSESDGKALRASFSKIIDDNDIDVVLQGHDHTYSRTFQLEGDVIQDVTTENGKIINPKGTLYMTANSATGSKYYELYPTQQNYIAARWQEYTPTYSTIDIDDVSFTINTYRVDTNEKIDNSYSIVKSLNKDNLNNLITSAEEKINNKDSFSNKSFNTLVEALNIAKEISNKSDANTDELANAYNELSQAINNLKDSKSDTPTDASDTTVTTDNNPTTETVTPTPSDSNKEDCSVAYNTSNKGVNTAKTGDNSHFLMYILGSLAAISSIGYVTFRKIRKINRI